ncbi:hypothetical protein ABZP36_011064 [Zizania latifolia]
MARRRALPLLLVLTISTALAVAAASAYARADGDCHGSDQLGGEGMTMMRRLLDDVNATALSGAAPPAVNATTSGYIGYGALLADRVPCTLRGASYYNCKPGAEANPYTRGCSAITQCRG